MGAKLIENLKCLEDDKLQAWPGDERWKQTAWFVENYLFFNKLKTIHLGIRKIRLK